MNKDQQLLAEAYISIYQQEEIDESLRGAIAAGILGALSFFGGNAQAQTPAQQPTAHQTQQIDSQTQYVLDVLTKFSQKVSKLTNDYENAYKNLKTDPNTVDVRQYSENSKQQQQLTTAYKQSISKLRADLLKTFNADNTKIEKLLASAINYDYEQYKDLAALSLSTGDREALNKWADIQIDDANQYMQQTINSLKSELNK
jgi:DNA-binding ferritin-like protein (Dps family)